MPEAADKTTRDRLIEAAIDLFQRKGYEATTVADILKQADVRSGSLYYFFESKEDLLLAVLDRYQEMLWPMVMEPVFSRIEDPIERIFGVLAKYREWILMTDLTYGCPIGNLALEVGNSIPAARQKILENFEGWRLAMRKCLEDAGPRLPADVDRDRLSAFVLTVMEGGVMQARTYRSIEPFDGAVAQLRAYMEMLTNRARADEGLRAIKGQS